MSFLDRVHSVRAARLQHRANLSPAATDSELCPPRDQTHQAGELSVAPIAMPLDSTQTPVVLL